MVNDATVLLLRNQFVAELADGQRLEHADLKKMAFALFRAGVTADRVRYDWRAGTCMVTAGQQVALTAEISRLEHRFFGLTLAELPRASRQ